MVVVAVSLVFPLPSSFVVVESSQLFKWVLRAAFSGLSAKSLSDSSAALFMQF